MRWLACCGMAAVLLIRVASRDALCADDLLRQLSSEDGPPHVLRELADARQQRLSEIARERERLLKQIQSKQDLVDYLNNWAMSESRLRSRVRPFSRETASRIWQRAWDRREDMLTQVVQFKEYSHASIVNGKALNLLLNMCGPAAVRRQRVWKSDQSEIDDRALTAEGRRLIAELRHTTVAPELIDRISYRQGIDVLKRTGRLSQRTALDLQWPLTLRDPKYSDLRASIESHRDQALRELTAGDPVSPRTASKLMADVDRLRTGVNSDLTRIIKTTSDVRAHWPYRKSVKHMDALTHGVIRFVSATQLKDVQLKPFDGTTVEDLLVYMHSNAITFAPADPNADVAYSQLFDLLSTYYINSILVDQLLQEGELEVRKLKSLIDQLMKLLLGDDSDGDQ